MSIEDVLSVDDAIIIPYKWYISTSIIFPIYFSYLNYSATAELKRMVIIACYKHAKRSRFDELISIAGSKSMKIRSPRA